MDGLADSRPVRLVVFDAGGVIVRVAGSWEEAQARTGIPSEGAARRPEFQALLLEGDRRSKVGEIDTATYTTQLADALGCSADDVARILEAYLLGEYPGWSTLSDRLDRLGVDTALLSNTNALQWELLSPTGPKAGGYPAIGRLRHRFASHQLGLAKPDPAIYAAVEKATGHAGDHVLFFDDKLENIEAARGCGWTAVQIDPAGDPASQISAVLENTALLTAGHRFGTVSPALPVGVTQWL